MQSSSSRARRSRSFFSIFAFVALVTLASGLVPAASVLAQGSTVPTPASVLGYRVGADRKLADWNEVVGYFGKLAAATPAVSIETLGKTTMGKPLIAAIISTPENVKAREAIFAGQRKLADPRVLKTADESEMYAHQPAVLVIQCNIHSDEIASSQMAMELAYRLATNDTLQAELRNAVVILIPSVNPDGEEMVVEWYRSQLGTQWEGGEMPWIYNKYTGHDDNRDWFMMTQIETRLVTHALYKEWLPEIFYDVHQQGSEGSRLFVPPFLDPVDPNIDPLIVRGHRVDRRGDVERARVAREDGSRRSRRVRHVVARRRAVDAGASQHDRAAHGGGEREGRDADRAGGLGAHGTRARTAEVRALGELPESLEGGALDAARHRGLRADRERGAGASRERGARAVRARLRDARPARDRDGRERLGEGVGDTGHATGSVGR